MKRTFLIILAALFWGTVLFPPAAFPLSQDPYPLLQDFQAFDLPNDGGDAIGLLWKALPAEEGTVRTSIYLAETEGGEYRQVGEVSATDALIAEAPSPWWTWRPPKGAQFYRIQSMNDLRLENGRTYWVKLSVQRGDRILESPVRQAVPRGNLFNGAKLNNLALVVAFMVVVFLSIGRARRNPNLFLRRIAGLDAVEEAIGRATEMGKPILYLTGSNDMTSLSTIAATVILGEVARRVATYETELKVPHRDPIVMAICQEIVKEAYLEAGRPDAYREDSNFFITADQFSYTASVDGIMLRDKPAANFFMGFYYAESLLLAEAGASTGAIQIAGTDSEHQLPFFVATCDYTLIGEELYAAGAYLSREPALLGTLRGQDLGKAAVLLVLIVGTALVILGKVLGTDFFVPFLQVFQDFR